MDSKSAALWKRRMQAEISRFLARECLREMIIKFTSARRKVHVEIKNNGIGPKPQAVQKPIKN